MRGEVFPTNRKNHDIILSAIIAPLKKAQRKSEGGQLFPESVFPLRASPFPKTPQNPPTPLFFKGVSVILLSYFVFSTRIIYCHCEEAERRSKLPGGWRSTEYVFRTLSVGYFACAQYDVKSPIGGVAATFPEGGSEINCVIAKERSDCGNPLE